MSDLISRQAAIDAVKKNTFRLTFAEEQNCEGHLAWSANAVYSDVIEGALLELPSAQPETTERTTETAQNVSDRDLISRKAAIDAIRASTSKYTGFMEMEMYTDDDAVEAIEALPPAQPERMRGRWIRQDNKGKPFYGWYQCSECGAVIGGKTNFCSECGADMREVNDERPD